MATNPARLAIIRYKLAARTYRRRDTHALPTVARTSYAVLQAAREDMLAALGYDRQYSYLGEFCNLYERDFPSYIRATARPCYYDGNHAAAGRIYRHSGWHSPVTWEEHRAIMSEARQRARYLQSILVLDPVDRFIHGWSITYKGFDEEWYMAAWRTDRAVGLSYLTVYGIAALFDMTLRMQPIMDESGARSFFLNLPKPKFQAAHSEDVWAPKATKKRTRTAA